MNLPASAHTFLPVFKELFPLRFKAIAEPVVPVLIGGNSKKKKKLVGHKTTSDWAKQPFNLPWIHCYGFSKVADPKADFLQTCEASIGHPLPGAKVRIVRDVSPKKFMILCSFPLPEEIAYAKIDELGKRKSSEENENPIELKKQKLT